MNARTLLYPAIAVLLVIGLIQLRPTKAREEPGRSEKHEPDDPHTDGKVRPFSMLRSAALPDPPHLRFIADPPERWFDRLLWAPSNLFPATQQKIADMPRTQSRRFVELVDAEWARNPERAHIFFSSLGQLADDVPRALEILIEGTRSSSNLVRDWATRGLMLVDSEEAALQVEQMLRDTSQQVRSAAAQALIHMKNPTALAALMRYAETNPDDGIRHVLYHLGEMTHDPAAIPVLRQYLDGEPTQHAIALQSLILHGDPNAIDIAYKQLEHPDPDQHLRALTMLARAPTDLLDYKRLLPSLDAAAAIVREKSAEILFVMIRDGGLQDPPDHSLSDVLLDLSNDRDYRVSQVSMAALYSLGRKDIAESYLKGIESTHGAVLHTNVDVATSLLKDDRALPAIRRRLTTDPPPDVHNVSVLLNGIGNLGDPAGADLLIDLIRGATAMEPVDENGSTASEKAAHLISNLGPTVLPELRAILEEPGLAAPVYLRTLDAMRGFSDPSSLDVLLAVAIDQERDAAVRKAAIETLPFLVGVDLFTPLMDVMGDLADNHELARAAQWVLADYA